MTEPTSSSREAGRVETFTDGVFVIAITLLVLELPVPEPEGFTAALLREWPSFLAYLAAFLTIAAIWTHHHAVFARIRGVEPAILLLNLLLLFGVALLPWPTSLVAVAIRDGVGLDGVVASCLFAAAGLVVTIAWTFIGRTLVRRPHLLVDARSVSWMRKSSRQALLAGVPVLAAAALSPVSPVISLVLFIAVPVYFLYWTSHTHPSATQRRARDDAPVPRSEP